MWAGMRWLTEADALGGGCLDARSKWRSRAPVSVVLSRSRFKCLCVLFFIFYFLFACLVLMLPACTVFFGGLFCVFRRVWLLCDAHPLLLIIYHM